MSCCKADTILHKVKEVLLDLGPALCEAEAIGILGSLARKADFTDRSDIDVFVIVKEKKPEDDLTWYQRISKVLEPLDRDVTVLVYGVKSLRRISNWYVLRLASEGIILFDRGSIAQLFQNITEAAHKAGLRETEEDGVKIWTIPELKLGEIVTVQADE
ncbi:MAG: nucleotidyltransferase domain-containing protein [Candidatus Tectomicrobia bacterium]|nr:nucleotidyltransferase domain-containing protein [Candidatus Tectomicrobia bacterium]